MRGSKFESSLSHSRHSTFKAFESIRNLAFVSLDAANTFRPVCGIENIVDLCVIDRELIPTSLSCIFDPIYQRLSLCISLPQW